MTENFAYWSVSCYEQENGSLRPSPLVPTLLPTWLTRCSLINLTSWSHTMSPPLLLIVYAIVPKDRNLTLMYLHVSEVVPCTWPRIQFTSHIPCDLQSNIRLSAYAWCSGPLFHRPSSASNAFISAWNFLYLLLFLSMYFPEFKLEGYFVPHSVGHPWLINLVPIQPTLSFPS